ncbi:MAG: V-type ATPase subunit [Thermoplasmatota archaeon]
MAQSFGKTNYPYAVARVQAKRSKLIPARDYEKILKMDVAEITRLIEESAYKAEVDELSSRFSGLELLEAALTVNQERVHQEIRQMLGGPGGRLVDLFLARYRAENLKTVLRGKIAGASRDELLKELLIEDLDTYGILAPLLGDDVQGLEGVMAALEQQGAAGREAAAVLRKVPAGSPQSRYEDAIDKNTFARLLAELDASKEKGAAEFRDFARREVDTRNLLNAARWAAAGQGGDFTPFVIPGGKEYSVATVLNLSRAKGLASFADAAKDAGLSEELQAALAQARESGRLAAFQAAMWKAHLAELDRLSHSHPLSILPILVFLVRKQREVTLLRAVARGRAAGLSESRLQELVA